MLISQRSLKETTFRNHSNFTLIVSKCNFASVSGAAATGFLLLVKTLIKKVASDGDVFG